MEFITLDKPMTLKVATFEYEKLTTLSGKYQKSINSILRAAINHFYHEAEKHADNPAYQAAVKGLIRLHADDELQAAIARKEAVEAKS